MEFNELFEIKKASEMPPKIIGKQNVQKHILWRMGILFAGISAIFLVLFLIENDSGIFAAIYLSGYFFIAWVVILAIESIFLYLAKKNNLANANLIVVFLIIACLALIFQEYF